MCLLTRSGTAQLPASSVLLQEDDVIQLMTPGDAIAGIDAALAGDHEGAHR